MIGIESSRGLAALVARQKIVPERMPNGGRKRYITASRVVRGFFFLLHKTRTKANAGNHELITSSRSMSKIKRGKVGHTQRPGGHGLATSPTSERHWAIVYRLHAVSRWKHLPSTISQLALQLLLYMRRVGRSSLTSRYPDSSKLVTQQAAIDASRNVTFQKQETRNIRGWQHRPSGIIFHRPLITYFMVDRKCKRLLSQGAVALLPFLLGLV